MFATCNTFDIRIYAPFISKFCKIIERLVWAPRENPLSLSLPLYKALTLYETYENISKILSQTLKFPNANSVNKMSFFKHFQ